MLSSIPSPGSNSFEIGPLELRAYGLMIAFGVLAAVWLASRRWVERGGSPDDMSSIAMWAVPAGLVGARLYHVITDWKRFDDEGWVNAFKIWEGGLGIPGGMALGILAGVWVVKRRNYDVPAILDSVAPALPLAQAIGRLGNWFNQELFGGPTDLPWGLEIDPENRPVEHLDEETFHPTFLYEAVWNLALVAFIIWIDRKKVLRPGALLAVYIMGYGIGRLWVELVRIDPASQVLGVRVNVWMSIALIGGGGLWLLRRGRRTDDDALDLDLDVEDDPEAADEASAEDAADEPTAADVADDDVADDDLAEEDPVAQEDPVDEDEAAEEDEDAVRP